MKIFLHDYAGHPFQAQLSRALARRGHLVVHGYADHLETPRGTLYVKPEDPESLRFWPVRMNPDYRRFKYNFIKRRNLERAYAYHLIAALDEIEPDVIISGNTPSEPQYHFQRAATKRKVPFVSWVQDVYSVAVARLAKEKYPLLAPFVVPFYRRWDREALRNSAHIVSITEDFVPIIRDLGCTSVPITVIPNWASLEEIPTQATTTTIWARAQHLNDHFVFLYTGTLAMKHNPELIAVLAEQFKDTPKVRVVVTSEGPGRTWLEQAQTERGLHNLLLVDFQPFEIYAEVLASADVLLGILEPDAGVFSVPSKVLSYLCAGRPLLLAIPQENLAAQIVRQSGAGVCVAPDDLDGFVREARSLVADASRRKQMGVNARAYAETHFAIEDITDQFENIFTQTQT